MQFMKSLTLKNKKNEITYFRQQIAMNWTTDFGCLLAASVGEMKIKVLSQ